MAYLKKAKMLFGQQKCQHEADKWVPHALSSAGCRPYQLGVSVAGIFASNLAVQITSLLRKSQGQEYYIKSTVVTQEI